MKAKSSIRSSSEKQTPNSVFSSSADGQRLLSNSAETIFSNMFFSSPLYSPPPPPIPLVFQIMGDNDRSGSICPYSCGSSSEWKSSVNYCIPHEYLGKSVYVRYSPVKVQPLVQVPS